jgi:NAD(P)-dependent dehydrogenase (short-subunit alcohol dehydrogenase family)
MDLNGKVALITGGANGMGAATAHRLAGLGATVVVADIDAARAEAVVAALEPAGRHRAVVLDVADSDRWKAVVADTIADLGGLDVLYLNAGIMSRPPTDGIADVMTALGESSYRKVMGVNVDGVVLGLLAALPHLEANGGDVVVTASVAGLTPLPIDPYYSMSKHALIGFVRSLAGLAERGIRVNAICPGGIDTAIVPDDLRASGISLSPASYIADTVVEVLESGRGGQIWIAYSVAQGTYTVDPPSLRPPTPQG